MLIVQTQTGSFTGNLNCKGGEVQQGHDNWVCKCNTMCLMCFKHFGMTCLWEAGAPNHSKMGGARPLEAHTWT